MTGWLRANLFSSPLNSALTVLAALLLYAIVPPVIQWAFIAADFAGETRGDCSRDGACWVFIRARFSQFIYGFYPAPERWRVNVAFVLLALAAAPLFSERIRRMRWVSAVFVFAFPPLAVILFAGGVAGLAEVETAKWGGLMLTLIVAGVGIAASLPIGILLALGRASDLPAIRALSIAFIELWRGVPLITVLFMAAVMLPLFLPEGVTMNKLIRALIGVSLFAGAYMAEVVRGGIQAIPRGQIEAGYALGLGYWRIMGAIVLPQALRIMIPGIVNVFVALFKDTTLVLIIGLFDFLGIIQAALSDPNWLGFAIEGYVFAAVVFWAFCYAMSRYSARLEHRLGGARRL
jgi:general L-amino acid transport system permease protein